MITRFLIALITLPVFAAAGFFVLACRMAEPAPFIPSDETRDEIQQASTIEIQYIANEGVLISSRNKRVLIDGLHRKYEDSYAYLPDAERAKIEAARVPFDKIDLVLVSHMHGDHFHPESVGLYLKNSPKAAFASSGQVVDQVTKNFSDFSSIKDRVTPITYTLKTRQPMNIAGIDVEFLGLGHGTGRHAAIQNLGHVITLEGKKLLHVGDTELSDEVFDAFHLEQHGIDIAILPYWFLTSKNGQAFVERHIKPKHVIATHVGPAEGEQVERQVKQVFPNADVFKTMLEKRSFK